MSNFVEGLPTFSSGAPFNDLEFTVFDTDYMDGENSGFDVFMPVDPADDLPGADQVKYLKMALNTDLNETYGAAQGDRIILGTAEIAQPFFVRGPDQIDNDYVVIQHFDYSAGYIQLRGTADDYRLVYATTDDGAATEGYYLFWTANESDPDLIAFIFPCDVLAPTISGNPARMPEALCNDDGTLSLTNPNHFQYAQPLPTQASVPNAVAQYGSAGKEVVSGITADKRGNMYLYGLTDGNLDGAEDAPNEMFVTKLNTEGDVVWVTEIPLEEGSIFKDATTDDEYIYAVGRTLGALPGETNGGRWDAIIVKLRLDDGTIVATNQYGTTGIDGYGNVVLDDAGYLYVSAQGAPQGGAGGTGGTDRDYLVAKHQAADLENVWRVIEPPNEEVIASAEAWGGITYTPGDTPGDGRLIIGGWYFASGGADAFTAVYEDLTADAPTRASVAKIDPDGTTADWVLDNVVDQAGNIYVAGYTTGDLDGQGARGAGDAYVAKYSPELTDPVFYQFGTDQSELVRKLEIDGSGNLYAVGYTYGDLFADNQDTSYRSGDIFVQKFDADLTPLESVQLGTPGEDRTGAALKGDFLYLGGMTEGSFAGASLGSFDAYALVLSTEDLSVSDSPNPVLATNEVPEDETLSVYPIPTSNYVTIQSSTELNGGFVIHNLLGELVLQGELNQSSHQIDLSSLTAGIYMLHVEHANAIQRKKLIKR